MKVFQCIEFTICIHGTFPLHIVWDYVMSMDMHFTLQVLNLLCKLTDQVVVKCPNGVAEDIIAYTLSIMYVNNA